MVELGSVFQTTWLSALRPMLHTHTNYQWLARPQALKQLKDTLLFFMQSFRCRAIAAAP